MEKPPTPTPSACAFTASQLAAALGKTPQAVRKQIQGVAATGSRVISGNIAEAWHIGALPSELQSKLREIAQERGYPGISEMFNGFASAWSPALSISEISESELQKAHHLRQALLPSLQKSGVATDKTEFEKAGVQDYRKAFGHPITRRHFRQLLSRTLERDSGLKQFDRLVLYVAERPARGEEQTDEQFPELQAAMTTLDEAKCWKAVFGEYDRLVAQGVTGKRAGRQLRNYLFSRDFLNLPRQTLKKAFARRLAKWVAHNGQPDALRDGRRDNGADVAGLTEQIESLGWFIPAAQFFYLITNRTKDSGSVPEAIRRTISLPNVPAGWPDGMKLKLVQSIGQNCLGWNGGEMPMCPKDLRELVLRREREGKTLVPARIAKIIVSKVTPQLIQWHRRPHEAELGSLSAPGTAMMVRHGDSDRNEHYAFAKAGGILEADDGSINLPVCVPWAMGGNPCADKFGVIIGRFQWIRSIDVGSRYRPGWVFVARLRGSYRGADVLTLLHGLTVEHGIWGEYRFEQGVFKSNLVQNAIKLMGARLHTVFSAHSKPFIEGGFNQDWTKLSVHFPHCDLGRYRGDTEETNRTLQACRAGHQDPRRIFPMQADVMKAFSEITAEENRTLVKSRNWGQWVPEERWKEQTAANPAALRKLGEDEHFIFAPYAMTWTVRGAFIGGRVPIFEDLSVPFEFSSAQLSEFDGARVRVHFDPVARSCAATAVLAENCRGKEGGHVIGKLDQVNETAGYVRMALGWADDDRTAGIRAKQQAAGAMRRELRTIMPGGRSGYARSEGHDGLGKVSIVQRDGRPDQELSKERLRQNLSGEPETVPPERAVQPGIAELADEYNPLEFL